MEQNYDETQLMIFEKPAVSCEDVDLLLGDYTDNDLPESLKARVDEHLACCAECEEGAKRYREVIELAGELKSKEAPMPDSVKENLRNALNKKLGISVRI